MDFHIEHAMKIATRSQNSKHRTGCVIADGDSVISTGWSHTGDWRFNDLYSIHAEIHAILRGRHVDLEFAVAYIATLSKSGRLVNAKPCLTCATALVGYGILFAEYSLDKENSSRICLPDAIKSSDLKVYNKRSDEIRP